MLKCWGSCLAPTYALNLLRDNNVAARSLPELAEVVAQHNGSTRERRFLLVPHHMIGARSMESAILGGHAEFVCKRHPEAPIPGFHLSDRLCAGAVRMRQRQRWRRGVLPGSRRQVQTLATPGTPAPTVTAAGAASAVAGIRRGLCAARRRTQHYEPPRQGARLRRGDPLPRRVDPLAGQSGGRRELRQQRGHQARQAGGGRQNSDRPIPLVSFVARQRDLRELVGENLAGSLQLQFSDVLRHWEARFHRITIEDRDLPAIAEKRVLRPRSEAARQTLGNAFDEFQKVRPEVWNALLTETPDKEMFRKFYPFSPALAQTLIAVSAALQRERTALKLMPHLERQHGVTGENLRIGDADPTRRGRERCGTMRG